MNLVGPVNHPHRPDVREQLGEPGVIREAPGTVNGVPDFFSDGDLSCQRALQLVIDGLFAADAGSLAEPDPVAGTAIRLTGE